jgi:hypothetical protein
MYYALMYEKSVFVKYLIRCCTYIPLFARILLLQFYMHTLSHSSCDICPYQLGTPIQLQESKNPTIDDAIIVYCSVLGAIKLMKMTINRYGRRFESPIQLQSRSISLPEK